MGRQARSGRPMAAASLSCPPQALCSPRPSKDRARKNCFSNRWEPRIWILCDWSKDGRFLVYSQPHPKAKYDLRIMPVSGNRKPIVFLHSEFNERCGALSPDGKWIAYASDESGKYEIYVQAFSEEGSRPRKKMAGLLQRRKLAEVEARRQGTILSFRRQRDSHGGAENRHNLPAGQSTHPVRHRNLHSGCTLRGHCRWSAFPDSHCRR